MQRDGSRAMTPKPIHDTEALLEQASWIRALARRLVGSEAEDLVQETWVTALERPPEGDRPLRPWLGRLVKNLAANRQRSRRHRGDREARVAAEAPEHSQQPGPQELVARSEQQREVVNAVLALEEPYRSVLLLRYYEGLEPREIQRQLDIKGSTLRTQLARGIEQVRQRLDECNGGHRDVWVAAFLPLAGVPASVTPLPTSSTPVRLESFSISNLINSLLAVPNFLKLALLALPLLAGLRELSSTWTPQELPAAIAPAELLAQSTSEPIPAPANPSEASSAARRPIDSVVLADASAEFSLRILDRRTGEPAWGFHFMPAEFADEVERVMGDEITAPTYETNAAGIAQLPSRIPELICLHGFESGEALQQAFNPGRGPSLPPSTPIVWDGNEGVAQVDLGPTILLNIDLPKGVETDELFAVLNERPHLSTYGSQPSNLHRLGGRTFVRFTYSFEGRDPWLHLFTLDGLHGASVPAAGYMEGDRKLALQVTGRAVLTCPIAAADDSPLTPTRVFLFPGERTQADVTQPFVDSVEPLEYGQTYAQEPRDAVFHAVQPGLYTLSLHARGFTPQWRTIELKAGRTSLPIVLERADSTTAVLEGRITSQSGQFNTPLHVRARDLNDWLPANDLIADVEWKIQDGQAVGTFRIEGAASAPHHVTVFEGDRGHFLPLTRLLPPAPIEAVPGDLLEIELEDLKQETIALRAKDAKSGEPLNSFYAQAQAGNGSVVAWGKASGGQALVRGPSSPSWTRLTVWTTDHQ